ncbi:MAG TPA: hypothetical protein VFA46_02145 [Actinomycetes bacterium]|jgi:hypothetical protein|nr:hypothetical protein [Actinomycetes bacterium]
MSAAVSSDRSDRLGIDQIEPWAGNAMHVAPVPDRVGLRWSGSS